MPAPYRRCRWAKATMRSRSVAFRSGAGVYRNAEGLMPTTASARRSLRPRSVMLRTSTRRAGAVTTFGEAPRGSPRSRAATPPIVSLAGYLGLELLQPLGVRDAHAAKFAPPQVVTGLGEAVLAAQVLNGHTRIGLAQGDVVPPASLFRNVNRPGRVVWTVRKNAWLSILFASQASPLRSRRHLP